VLDDVGKLNIARNLGMLMFQRYFHELFVTGVLNEFVPPYLQGRRLSPRELQCLKLSAAGLSGEDIGNKLDQSAYRAEPLRLDPQQAGCGQSAAAPPLRHPQRAADRMSGRQG